MGTENRLPDDVAEKGEGAIAPTAAAGDGEGAIAPTAAAGDGGVGFRAATQVGFGPPAAPAVFIFDGDKATVVTFDIPDGVTKIGNNAFYRCTSLVSINLPDGVTEIGHCAFYGCTSLVSINLPNGVTVLGYGAFIGCKSLVSINLPDGVTKIGRSAFNGCTLLVSINLPDGVTEISDYAFDGCTEIERKATEAGLSTIEWGRSNWRKDVAIKRMKIIRYSVVGCISALQHLNFDELRDHILSNPVEQPVILHAVVCFLVELGEPGLVREIVKFIA
jgi:hypothetical protein